MLFALDICVKKKASPTHSVHWGLNPHLKFITPSFAKSSIKSANYPSPPFLGNSSPHPTKNSCTPLPKKKHSCTSPSPQKSDFPLNSHNIKIFHH